VADAFVVTVAAVLGLAVGSFLNVVVWRVPRGESLVRPASHCPRCEHPIRAWDNIPVLSWLILRARCRDCGEPIAARYPLVEASTGVLFAGVAWWALATGAIGEFGSTTAAFVLALVAYLYLAAISIALALIDLDTQRLPNVIVLPSYLVAAVLLVTSALLAGQPERLIPAAIGMAALFVFYLVLALSYAGGMGFGDVKLAGVLGLYLGYLGFGPLAVGAFAAFLLGGVFGIVMMLARRGSRKTKIPFGPWMLAGAWVGIFIGDVLFTSYLGLFGLA
jgi:leader peptidase (prepilin peptidase)/N-methyltransferase